MATAVKQDASLGDGVLNVNKPASWTSHDVVAKLRGLFRGPKLGHAGTLDPSATGVLPVLVGRGTRIAEYLLDWDKEYHAVLRLGETTDTQDATGAVLARVSLAGLTEERIRSAVARFHGRIAQLPPMYSAVKVGGVPLYKSARAGRTVERGLREVTVHELEVRGIAGSDVALHIRCSKGTYVRTLCADIGEVLGVGGHLLALERRRVGPLAIERSLSLDEVSARFSLGQLAADVLALDDALQAFPALVVDERTAARALHGVPVAAGSWKWETGTPPNVTVRLVRVKGPTGRLLAVGGMAVEPQGSGPAVTIEKVLVDPETVNR